MDYDGERFKKTNFISSVLSYLWFRFWWAASLANIVRYCTLAALSLNEHLILEFYLDKLHPSKNFR